MIRKILLWINGIMLAICFLIGMSYAYFLANVKYINHSETVILSNILNLKFTDTKEVVISDIIPGDIVNKTFEVLNSSDRPTTYNLYFRGITNEFNSDLVYELYEGETLIVSETVMPQTGDVSYIKKDISINSAETKNYTLKIKFLYNETVDQNSLQGAKFNSTIEINTQKVDGDIKTATNYILAKNTVIEDNSLTDGLFKTNDTNSINPVYYFKGNVNNIVSFANSTWKIVRINEDGTIRIIKTDSINDENTFNAEASAENAYNFKGSNVNNILTAYYNNDLKDYKDYMTLQSYCTEYKVSKSDQFKVSDANINYIEYNPNAKCSNLESFYIGLLSIDDVMLAGSIYSTGTYVNSNNYLNGLNTYTLSPAGVNNNNHYVWKVNQAGNYSEVLVSNIESIRPVINLRATLNASGLGTIDNPYTFSK